MFKLKYPLAPSSFRISHLLCLIILFAAVYFILSSFGLVLRGLFDAIVNPLIALLVGKPDFSAVRFQIAGTVFPFGNLINALVMFGLSSGTIYFAVIVPTLAVMTRLNRSESSPDPLKKCSECLSEIPLAARKCSHCGSAVS